MECKLTRKICKLWRKSGAIICTTDSVGWPDRWVGWRGMQWWLEFKENSEVRPHQLHVMKKLRACGAAVWVIRIYSDICHIEDFDRRVVKADILWDDVLFNLQVLDKNA